MPRTPEPLDSVRVASSRGQHNVNVEVKIDPDLLMERAMRSFQTMHTHSAAEVDSRLCFCNGQPVPVMPPPQAQEATFDKSKIKLSDLADITIVEAPSLVRLQTFKTAMLEPDNNTPLSRAIKDRMN